MNLLITGAAGFIGSALTTALRTAGHTVTALDDLSVHSPRPHPDHLLQRDVRTLTAGDLDGFHTVIHLAAHKSVPRSFEVGGFEHNTAADRHLIHTFATSGADRLLLASSCEVYGDQRGPLAESAPHRPRSPYAAGKATTEHLADIYRPQLGPGRQIGVARFFNTYGPWEDPDAVVPAFIDAALADRPLTIEGTGTQARDLTHIDTTTAMLGRILDADQLLPVVNIGSGQATTVLDLARAVIRATGRGTITHVPPRPNEIRSFTADTSLFTATYGPLPRQRPLPELLAETARLRALSWTPAGAAR
ncbi:NAD-dependent epimerase/dehydratase family protein [Kitasatospora sp. NPDC088783]|uniref:NAD-dependent epimerase/dehydratase family protein n=1 Tax=Kitasatospora sp. NPDC088783 TaxID=3364077 RepID=UPI003819879A